jgi:predicted RecA/RadA family phage recombinase
MPAIVFVQSDVFVDYVPAADVAAGAIVIQVDLVGIAPRPIPANTLGGLAVEGIFDFPKATGVSTGIPAGTKVYWDGTNLVATATVGTNKYLGKTTRVCADADTTVRVRLCP